MLEIRANGGLLKFWMSVRVCWGVNIHGRHGQMQIGCVGLDYYLALFLACCQGLSMLLLKNHTACCDVLRSGKGYHLIRSISLLGSESTSIAASRVWIITWTESAYVCICLCRSPFGGVVCCVKGLSNLASSFIQAETTAVEASCGSLASNYRDVRYVVLTCCWNLLITSLKICVAHLPNRVGSVQKACLVLLCRFFPQTSSCSLSDHSFSIVNYRS